MSLWHQVQVGGQGCRLLGEGKASCVDGLGSSEWLDQGSSCCVCVHVCNYTTTKVTMVLYPL